MWDPDGCTLMMGELGGGYINEAPPAAGERAVVVAKPRQGKAGQAQRQTRQSQGEVSQANQAKQVCGVRLPRKAGGLRRFVPSRSNKL